MKQMQPDAIPPNEQPTVCRMVDPNDTNALGKVAEFAVKVMDHAMTVERLQDMMSYGARTFAVYSGDRIVGVASAFTEPIPNNPNPMTRNLPPESIFGLAAFVDPNFRGSGLQKTLLEARKNLVREMGKETFIGTVILENGASTRNVMNAGGRILYSAPKFAPEENSFRLLEEIDITLENKEKETVNQGEDLGPQDAVAALLKGEKRIVLRVQSGKEGAGIDIPAQEATGKILSLDYVGTGIQMLSTDGEGNVVSGVVFRHLSSFSPDVAKRLRERKEKIKSLL